MHQHNFLISKGAGYDLAFESCDNPFAKRCLNHLKFQAARQASWMCRSTKKGGSEIPRKTEDMPIPKNQTVKPHAFHGYVYNEMLEQFKTQFS